MSAVSGFFVFISGLFLLSGPLTAREHPVRHLLSQSGGSIITYMCRYDDSDWTMSEVKRAIINDYSAAYEEYLPWSFNRFSGQLYDYSTETHSFRPLFKEFFDEGTSRSVYSSSIAGEGRIAIKAVGTKLDPSTGAYSIPDYEETTLFDWVNGIEIITSLSPVYEQVKSYDCMFWPQPPAAWGNG